MATTNNDNNKNKELPQREQAVPGQHDKERPPQAEPEPPLGETNDDEGADGLNDDEAEETGDELRDK